MEIKVWILLPVVGLLIAVLGWALRYLVNGFGDRVNGINLRLDRLIHQNEETGKELTRQNSEIGNIRTDLKEHAKRLDDHAGRIREIEIKQARWEN